MDTRKIPENWVPLLLLLRSADTLTPEAFIKELGKINLEGEIVSTLISAIGGDNRPINNWLFTHRHEANTPLVWLAPTAYENRTHYAWMIGYRSQLAEDVEQRFAKASKMTVTDPLLLETSVPSPLLFVDPVEVSQKATANPTNEVDYDEFAIFQTNYKGTKTEVSDLEQRMVMNTKYLISYREKTLRRAKLLLDSDETLDSISTNIELLALLHTEGHNRGHFLGPWPLDKQKKIVLYEALEEFRACLVAIKLGEHLGLTRQEQDALAVSAFFTRFLGYGYDAYCLPEQRRRTTREITVGLMFFQTLIRKEAISFNQKTRKFLKLGPTSIRQALLEALDEIHRKEFLGKRNVASLRDSARHWYGVAFPNRNYSEEAVAVYTTLSQ